MFSPKFTSLLLGIPPEESNRRGGIPVLNIMRIYATKLRHAKKLFVRASELRSNFHLKSLNQITNHAIT